MNSGKPPFLVRRQLRLALFAFSCLMLICCFRILHAETEPNESENVSHARGQIAADLGYRGTADCEACHADSRTYARGGSNDRGDWILANEMTVWSTQDIHSQAFRLLKESPLTERMAENLGTTKEKLVQDNRCLSCHFPFGERIASSPTVAPVPEGVNCEACHGPAEKWYEPHIDLKWRKTSVAEKAKLGMRDMADPVAQAEQCFSCHVGQKSSDPFQHRLVTHEMYAAGHPPLPSIEVASFSNALPHHWRFIEQKLTSLPEWFEQFKAKRPRDNRVQTAEDWRKDFWPEGIDLHEKSRTKLVLIGNVVSLRKSMEWLGVDQIDALHWPHLENYDCYACHHDLRVSEKSWRQKRGGSIGKPGRPMMRRWPMVIVDLAVAFARQQGKEVPDIRASVRALDHLFGAVPFGDPAVIAPAAKRVEENCNRLLEILGSLSYDQKQSALLMSDLVEMASAPDRWMDYDEARQVGWALRIFWSDSHESFPKDRRADVEEQLGKLNHLLSLDLPGRVDTDKPLRAEVGVPYQNLADYDADAFKEIVAALNASLQAITPNPSN